jgi:regulator of protease activity HflC (stomatin/prohibitin superfamily)
LGGSSLTLGGLTSVAVTQDPTTALQLTTKQYVDALIASGIHFHQPVRVESPIALTATYNNGTAGVGATLTNAGTQVALVIDGVTVAVNDRVLIYLQADQTQNGIYVVTNVGSGSTNR